ncbi:MAG: L-fuculokinase [Acidobacteriota bacterium]
MATVDLVLAVDLGTTCFKAALFGRSGRICGLGRVTVDKDEAVGQRCELPLERFWASLSLAVGEAFRAAGAGPDSVRAMCYSSQANSFLLMDAGGMPLTPLILWPDRRAAGLPPEPRLEAFWKRPDFLNTTGLGLGGPEFCVHKLAWFRRLHPGLWSACSRVMTMSDYLVFSLTGVPAGDQGTAALLGLLDLRAGRWWDKALEAARIAPEQLFSPLPPGTVAGVTSSGAAGLLGLPAGIPLAVGSLDHHAAAIGAGICAVDAPSISIGTVVACVRYCDSFSFLPDCAMGPGTHGYPFYLLAFEENGTGAVDRYHREHCPGLSFPDMLAAVDSVGPGSDGLMASPAIAGKKEVFHRLGVGHTEPHFVRALMESTAASLLEMIERLYPSGRLPARVAATGGGARSDAWLQVFADVCGIEFAVPACAETACLGAGMMAAVAAGWFDCLSEVTRSWSAWSRVIRPDSERHKRYGEWLSEYRTISRQPTTSSQRSALSDQQC